MINILIVEDDHFQAAELQEEIENLGHTVIGVAHNVKEFEELTSEDLPDLVIMDIDLNDEKDGVELAVELNEIQATPVIYLTDKGDKRTLNRVSKGKVGFYIDKPILNYKKLSINIEQLVQQHRKSEVKVEQEYCFLSSINGRDEKVGFKDIVYFKAEGAYTKIFHKQKEYTLSKNLKNSLVQVPDYFFRVHRSYAVNLHQILRLEDNQVITLKGGIPVSKTAMSKLREAIPTL